MADRPSPASTDDEIGIWSENIKHNFLRGYLPARRRILRRYGHYFPGGDHYVDGFAGSGIAKIRGEDRRVPGSPRIALELEHPFDYYWFNELDPIRHARLQDLVSGYPERSVRLLSGDCNKVITQQVTSIIRADRRARGFVFLDPFGMNLNWGTVEAVAETRGMETIINLSTMGMSRAGLPRGIDGLKPEHVERMNRAWGSDAWLDAFYERRQGLWGDHLVKVNSSSALRLGTMYKERLETIFSCVSDPLPVYANGRPIYCLLFAGPNATGLKIAADVLSKLSQAQLIESTPTVTPLALPLLEVGQLESHRGNGVRH